MISIASGFFYGMANSLILTRMGASLLDAINNGFHMAFIGAAVIATIATVVALSLIKAKSQG